MLVVQPYDLGAMGEIERAILESDLGINPTNDGKILRLNIPQLTAVSHLAAKTIIIFLKELILSTGRAVKTEPIPG